MWRDNAINKIDELIDYIKYLSDVEDSENDGTEEGYEVTVNHINYQNKIIMILEQIKKDYELYKGYEDFKNDEDVNKFYNKYQVISYYLMLIDEYKPSKEDEEYFKRLKDDIRYD